MWRGQTKERRNSVTISEYMKAGVLPMSVERFSPYEAPATVGPK
jgi:hypothetical protein